MINRFDRIRMMPIALVGAIALAVAGCGGIEVESKLLEKVGLTGKSGKGKEKQISGRAPLIVPPSTEVLPEPGSGQTQVATGAENFPQNPEEIEKRRAEENKKKQQAECADENGTFGSRQSGKMDDFDGVGQKNAEKTPCSSPLKDLLGNSL